MPGDSAVVPIILCWLLILLFFFVPVSAVSHLYRGFLHVEGFGYFLPAHLLYKSVSVYCSDDGIFDGSELVPDNPLGFLGIFFSFGNGFPESFTVDNLVGCGISVSTAVAYTEI